MADTAIGVPLFYLLPCQAWINFIFSTGVILQHSSVWASWFLELHHYRLNAILLDLSGSLYFWAGVCLGGIFVSSYSFAAVYCLQTCQSSKTQSCSRHRCFFVFFSICTYLTNVSMISPDQITVTLRVITAGKVSTCGIFLNTLWMDVEWWEAQRQE